MGSLFAPTFKKLRSLFFIVYVAPNCTPVPVDTSLGTIDFYSLVVEGEYMFVQKSVGDVTSLYVSHKRGPFKKAFFPSKLHQVVSFI